MIEQTWLTRYPWPDQVVYDRGSEFLAEFQKMITRDYNVTKKPITVRNPQANSIVERVHQTMGNMLRTFQVQKLQLDPDDPWSGILSAIAFGIRSTVHTTTKATPMQLVFGRDAILNIRHVANWRYIVEQKQKLINQNNKRENSKRKNHRYKVNDYVLVKLGQAAKYGTDSYKGPFQVTKINSDNGTARLTMNNVTDTYNLRNIVPYLK